MIRHQDWPDPLYELMQQGKKREPRPQLMQQRVLRFLELLHHPEKGLRIVLVTGTNGKGSVATLLAASLESTTHPVGLFVSPHLTYVSERIRIQQKPLSPEKILRLSKQVLPLVQQLEQEALIPSFFETMLMIALLAFQEEHVFFAILEAGVGGTRDATACLPAILGVLTTVHWDHQKELGLTLEDIARDKIGIATHSKKLVLGPSFPDPLYQWILQESIARQIQVYSSKNWCPRLHWTPISPETGQQAILSPEEISFTLPFWGKQQQHNVAIVLESLRLLSLQFPEITLHTALKTMEKATLPGRFQWISNSPPWVLDIAHNEEALRNLLASLDELVPFAQRKLLFGVSQDKQYDSFLELVGKLAPFIFLVAAPHRGENPQKLAEKLAPFAQTIYPYTSLEEGIQAFAQKKEGISLGIVTGSVFLVGEANYWLQTHQTPLFV